MTKKELLEILESQDVTDDAEIQIEDPQTWQAHDVLSVWVNTDVVLLRARTYVVDENGQSRVVYGDDSL